MFNKPTDYLPGRYPRPIHDKLSAVPDSLTQVIGSDCVIKRMHFTNLTSSTVTVTVRDNQDTPRFVLKSHPIGANLTLSFDYPGEGIPMDGGIRWQASAADSVDGIILGNSSNG